MKLFSSEKKIKNYFRLQIHIMFLGFFVITIVGAGKVGSAAAFNILQDQIGDVVLVDLNADLAKGEALDMMQAAPAIEFDGKIQGTDDFSEMEGSELVIVIAGKGRTPGMTRIDLMNINAKIVRSVVKEVARYAPDCKLMIVTNPVDVMTFIARKESGLPPNHVFGMGNILDTLRFRSYIAQALDVSREDTYGLVIGEHGESMVPLVEYASISGIPITTLLSKSQIENIVNKTRTSGADVIKLKGATTYAPGAVIAMMADAVLKGRNRVMSVSTCPQGEYSCSAVSIGVPVVLGKNGVERIIELKLSPESKVLFEKSVTKVKKGIATLNF
ncbi:MAG: malate dehydrogenase [Candidatus Bathyarchaeum sp.]|nr:MAG: malate dehydrogenase [Candidatus Bathyarchaeum sp.]